ncbi:MAG: Na+/H+ antiporter subunit E [Spirochaetales bacterium]|nr:Na+/H+ antiporter subunit E [Spirochaetales bacterium]
MDTRRRWRLVRVAQTFGVLLGLWFLFSWSLEPTSVVGGLLFAGILATISYDVFIEEHEAARHSVLPRVVPAATFLLTLIASMYASSFSVLVAVCTGDVQPRVVHFRSKLRADLARVVLAESITFTPGTIALELDEDQLIVHWLTATTRHSARAGDEVKGSLERAIKRAWL